MRAVFLEVDTERNWAVASVGPAFIAAFLRAHGHEAVLVRARLDMTDEVVVAMAGIVAEQRPEILGVSMTTRQWLRASRLIAAIRPQIDVPVIAGGLHATFSPQDVLAAAGFDYVCLGEGEAAMLDLVNALAIFRRTTWIGPRIIGNRFCNFLV
jgi:radical SAM superfamily enzyme YgiQ (UPF0313 family)